MWDTIAPERRVSVKVAATTGAAMLVACLLWPAGTLGAQGTPGSASTRGVDSMFAEARKLIESGKSAEGRKLGDSILASIPVSANAYGDALYGHAAIAASAADSERDYRRIVAEYPLASHAGDALLQLAQIEQARGDRAAAVDHLSRFWRENAESPSRPSAGLALGRLLFDQNEPLRACTVLGEAKRGVAPGDVELQNQINFLWGRCPALLAAAKADSAARAAAVADSAKAAASADSAKAAAAADSAKARARADSLRAKAAARSAKSTQSLRYTVQVAAYPTRAEAQRLADRLIKQGLEAYVLGSEKPFRVRVGHFATRAEATKAATALKKSGYDGFIATVND